MEAFTLFAKLVLDTSEYEDGINRANGLVGTLGNGLKTAMGIGAAAIGAATTAIVGLAGASTSSYAEIEQLRGGVKKLFGDEDAKTVIDNANKAFSTAGMSAQQYMDQVTSFSAALVGSLGGDTAEAANRADVAMRAISDNFNTFGGDIQNVQNAFQGFAKQNYTMLDNLKLGYGGTKTEMERLIADANDYAKTIGQAGNLSIDSFADVVTAIDLVQQKQGIAGTTFKEAASTVSGSMGSVKAAWENLVAGFSDPEADLGQLMSNVVDNAEVAFENLLPVFERALEGIGTFIEEMGPVIAEKLPGIVDTVLPTAINAAVSLVGSLAATLPNLAETLVNTLRDAIITYGPGLLEAGKNVVQSIGSGIVQNAPAAMDAINSVLDNVIQAATDLLPGFLNQGVEAIVNMANGLLEGAPNAITNMGEILNKVVDAALAAIPAVLEAGVQLIVGLAQGLIQNAPEIVAAITQVLANLLTTIAEHLPQILQKGVELIGQFAAGIIQAMPDVIAGIQQIDNNITETLAGLASKAIEWGLDLIKGFAKGIMSGVKFVTDAVGNVVAQITGPLHFSRPDEGPLRYYEEWMPHFMQGLAEGIESNMWRIEDAVGDVAGLMTLNPDPALGTVGGGMYSLSVGDIIIYGGDAQSNRELADMVLDELDRRVRSERAAHE